jgi:hypothetical protein
MPVDPDDTLHEVTEVAVVRHHDLIERAPYDRPGAR